MRYTLPFLETFEKIICKSSYIKFDSFQRRNLEIKIYEQTNSNILIYLDINYEFFSIRTICFTIVRKY